MALETSTVLVVGKVISVGCIGIYAGQALFYNAILMPVLRRTPSQTALAVALTGASFLSGAAVYYKTDNIQYLIPPFLLAINVPFTFAFIMPVNRELFGILDGTGKKNSTVEQLLNKWDLLHFGRTVLGTTAFVLALYGAFSDKSVIRF
ncbi:hypothetical protein CPC16_006522 [Podila verticillata]|nr:hypothetical protein BGZ52_013183 [Haplosporangium bisporale]KAF9212221.1 hypothetical protein BGZ59_007067 [Podila verticillata]KAF9388384.1 hypothetical protein CPC16_006522 [Podila verticillata]